MRRLLILMSAVALLSACKAQQAVTYFQDTDNGSVNRTAKVSEIRMRPDDRISIIVNSRDYQLMNLFNLITPNRTLGMTTDGRTGNASIQGYCVDKEGNIDFPVLGKIKVAGMTRQEIGEYIKDKLVSSDLVKDAVVTVDYVNQCVNIMGEVNRPGRYAIDRDIYTILDAISAAGDLTINGLRDRVKVTRTNGNEKETYVLNLQNEQALISSPAYCLQQNDIIYVEPNSMKARQSTVNGNNVLSASFWLSLASFLTTICLPFIMRKY